MGDANPIRTLGDYSKPSNKGYRNTIELLVGKNVVPLPSDGIRGPHDTQYYMENPEQAFVEYAFSCIDEAGGTDIAKVTRKEPKTRQKWTRERKETINGRDQGIKEAIKIEGQDESRRSVYRSLESSSGSYK
nr:hypothetical protein [Tanacetum cinerariifolium]